MKKTTRISLLIVFTLAFLLTALPALAAIWNCGTRNASMPAA